MTTTSQTTSELYMDSSTSPLDVLDFVAGRTDSPVVLREGEVTVYNYHNRPLDVQALTEWAAEADPGVYVLPYQVSGVWAFIQRVLPKPLRDADLLAYRQSTEAYVDYANWRRTYVEPDAGFECVSEREAQAVIADIHHAALEVLHDDA